MNVTTATSGKEKIVLSDSIENGAAREADGQT